MDVNIVMYAAGAPHPHKEPCLQFLQQAEHEDRELVSDTETLQELLYRYWHLGNLNHGLVLVEQAIRVVPTILPVDKPDVIVATSLLAQYQRVEPRDAIHAAVMFNHGLTHLYSYDRHFDVIPGLKRLEP